MHSNNQLTQPGDTIPYVARGTTITLTRTIDGGITRNVFHGPNRVDVLCRSYTDEHTARAQARLLAAALNDGMSVWAFAADAQAAQSQVIVTAEQIIDDALQAATAAPVGPASDRDIAALQAAKPADDTDALAARINADWDARDQQDRRDADQLAADVADIMATSRGFRDYAHPTRQVRPTMAGAHLADVTTPQQRALAAQQDGIIWVGPGIGGPTLKAMARKGLGRLTYEGSRYRIVALILNARGLAEARVAA